MATHTHLERGSKDYQVSPDDVESLRRACRELPVGIPLRLVLDDLLRALCSSGETGRAVVVDIGTTCQLAPRSR